MSDADAAVVREISIPPGSTLALAEEVAHLRDCIAVQDKTIAAQVREIERWKLSAQNNARFYDQAIERARGAGKTIAALREALTRKSLRRASK